MGVGSLQRHRSIHTKQLRLRVAMVLGPWCNALYGREASCESRQIAGYMRWVAAACDCAVLAGGAILHRLCGGDNKGKCW